MGHYHNWAAQQALYFKMLEKCVGCGAQRLWFAFVDGGRGVVAIGPYGSAPLFQTLLLCKPSGPVSLSVAFVMRPCVKGRTAQAMHENDMRL